MRVVVLIGTIVVVLSTAANLLHGVAHEGQQVMSLPAWQWVYVILVIFVLPVGAAALLWTRYPRAGAWLLFASMVGSLVFGLAYHFLIPGPDNAFTLQPGTWRTLFQVSAALTLLLQGIGSVVGVWALSVLSPFRTTGSTARLSSTWQDSQKEPR
jgi:hypothetical protein